MDYFQPPRVVYTHRIVHTGVTEFEFASTEIISGIEPGTSGSGAEQKSYLATEERVSDVSLRVVDSNSARGKRTLRCVVEKRHDTHGSTT